MDPARWARVEAIVADALDCEPAGRAALIAAACGGDHGLQYEVGSLLAEHDAALAFLEEPIGDVSALAALGVPDADLSSGIGPYRLLRRLGRGGMGDVFLASRDF